MQKLASISDRFQEVEKQVGDPEVIADQHKYRDLMREYKRLGPIVDHFNQLSAWRADRDQAEEWAAGDDADFKELAEVELPEIKSKLEAGLEEARILLLPKDEVDDRPVMMEFRAGTGEMKPPFLRVISTACTKGIARARVGVGNWSMPMKELLVVSRRLRYVLRVRAYTAG